MQAQLNWVIPLPRVVLLGLAFSHWLTDWLVRRAQEGFTQVLAGVAGKLGSPGTVIYHRHM